MLPTFTCVGHRNSTVSAIQMPARLQDHHRGAPSTASNHDQPRTRHSHTTVHTARRTGCDPQVGRGVTLTGLQGQAVLKGCEHRLVSTDRSVSMAVPPKKSEGFQHPELWTKTFTDTVFVKTNRNFGTRTHSRLEGGTGVKCEKRLREPLNPR